MDTTLRKLKLVNEQELTRLIEKQIRQYDPGLKVLANIRHEMDTVMERDDLLPEEKLALYKSAQLRFAKIKPSLSSNVPSINQLHPPTQEIEPADALEPLAPANDPMPFPLLADPGDAIDVQAGDMQNIADTTPSMQSRGDEKPKERDVNVKHEPIFQIDVDPKYKDKLATLTSLLSKNSALIAHDPATGEMKIKGQNIKDSKYGDLLRSLYHTSKNHNLNGQDKFFNALKEVFSGDPKLRPTDLIGKKEYLSHFPSSASSVPSSEEHATSTTSTNTRHASSRLQQGKGGSLVSPPLFSTSRPPGKKIKLLKCYS